MNDKIKHNCTVVSIDRSKVCVRILQTSACSACKVASHCNAAESKEKIIEVSTAASADYVIGDTVVVSTSPSAVSRAMTIAFVFPFLVMVAAVLIALWITSDEILSALIGLGVLVPYYLIIYFLGERVTRGVSFEIEKTNE